MPLLLNSQEGFFYIPPGRSAILNLNSKKYGVAGLFTELSSNCVLAVYLNTSAILFNVDAEMLLSIKSQLTQLVLPGATAFLIFNKEGVKKARELNPVLSPHLTLNLRLLVDKYQANGVTLRFENEKIKLHATTITSSPTNLLFHPDHRRLTAVKMIEQIVGQRAFLNNQPKRPQAITLFNGGLAIYVNPSAFVIDESHKFTQGEIRGLRTKTSFFGLLDGLLLITRLIMNTTESPTFDKAVNELSFTVQCLEDYLDSFASLPEIFFRRNMHALYLGKQFQTENEQDHEHKQKFFTLLENPVIEITEIFSQYSQCAESSQYLKEVLRFFRLFQEHYNRRVIYQEQESKLQEKRTFLENKYEMAKKEFHKNNFKAAADLFRELETDSAVTLTTGHPLHLKIICNYGRALTGLADYDLAKKLFVYSHKLAVSLFPDKNHEKYSTLIQDCDARLDQARLNQTHICKTQNTGLHH